MMKLTCHTRGGSSPQGKARVYYAAHPADLKAFSGEIFADILKTQNCAIYYDQQPESPWDQVEGCRQALELAQDLFARVPTPEARKTLWEACQRLGDCHKAQGNFGQAREFYQKGLDLILQLFETEKSEPVRGDLAAAYQKLGDLSRAEGDAQGARQRYQKGLELLNRRREAEYPLMQEGRAALYESLASLSLAEQKNAQAKDYFLGFVEQLEELTAQTGSLQAQRRLAGGYSSLANLIRAEKDPLRAGEYAQKSLELLAALYQRQSTVPLGRDLAAVEIQAAVILGDLGQNSRAVALLDQALELCGQLYSRTSADTDYHQAASACYYAGLLAKDRALQRERLSQARQLWAELEKSNPANAAYGQYRQEAQRRLNRLG